MGSKTSSRAPLKRLLAPAIEEVILKELRCCQAYFERVDGVEYLLFVFTLSKVYANEPNIRLDRVPVDFVGVNVLRKQL